MNEYCGTCGRELSWVEIAFGKLSDPVCGRCLTKRTGRRTMKTESQQAVRVGTKVTVRLGINGRVPMHGVITSVDKPGREFGVFLPTAFCKHTTVFNDEIEIRN